MAELEAGQQELEQRQKLGKLLRESSQGGSRAHQATAEVESLLKLSIASALHAVKENPHVGKLPFLLFEDLIESTTLDVRDAEGMVSTNWSARRAWDLLESCREDLTEVPGLFSRGKLVLLRLCNSLVRRLSKAQDTEWCGRILMFLTAAYPLSERSAVNVKGEANLLNVTAFETVEEADLAQVEFGEIGTEASSTPACIKATDLKQTGTEIEPAMKSGKQSDKVTVDYDLYGCLWGLQRWMVDPHCATSSRQEWDKFVRTATTVVEAFEFYRFTDHELSLGRALHQVKRQAIAAEAKQGDGPPLLEDSMVMEGGDAKDLDDIGGVYHGCKYLTTSRLLRLQLVDPEFRMQVITQLLILLTHARAASVAGDASAVGKEVIQNAAKGLEYRLEELLSKTPPNGSDYSSYLTHVLGRESAWTNWKDKTKCRKYERGALASSDTVPKTLPIRKRRRERDNADRNAKVLALGECAEALDLEQDTIGVEKGMPELHDFMEGYLEADDPANCIEDAYHPKHEKGYTWRATRLIMTTRPNWLQDLSNGQLDKVVDKIKLEAASREHPGTATSPNIPSAGVEGVQ